MVIRAGKSKGSRRVDVCERENVSVARAADRR
jgi:hypothetical protein